MEGIKYQKYKDPCECVGEKEKRKQKMQDARCTMQQKATDVKLQNDEWKR